MPFDFSLRYMLEQFTNNPPSKHTQWSGPWTHILNTLFPLDANYLVCPQRRRANEDLVYQVERFTTTTPHECRTVLIVDLNTKDSQHFERGKDAILQRIEHKAQKAFERAAAVQSVYWIGVIGPHWIYGEKEDGQDLRPLIDWHHVTHDEASYHDFLELADLVATLQVNQ